MNSLINVEAVSLALMPALIVGLAQSLVRTTLRGLMTEVGLTFMATNIAIVCTRYLVKKIISRSTT